MKYQLCSNTQKALKNIKKRNLIRPAYKLQKAHVIAAKQIPPLGAQCKKKKKKRKSHQICPSQNTATLAVFEAAETGHLVS